MLTYPKSTMCIQRMPMHLSLDHVALMPGKFSPPFYPSFPNFPQSELGRRADSRWALPQISSLFFSTREISKMCGPTGVKFCTMVSNRPYFIMPVQNFGGHTPKKFQGPKTCKIWPDFKVFKGLQSSAVNIFETDEDIQNRIDIPSIAIPPALGETSPVKFGPVTLKISMLNRTHLKCIFQKNIFRPLVGAAPPNFYTR